MDLERNRPFWIIQSYQDVNRLVNFTEIIVLITADHFFLLFLCVFLKLKLSKEPKVGSTIWIRIGVFTFPEKGTSTEGQIGPAEPKNTSSWQTEGHLEKSSIFWWLCSQNPPRPFYHWYNAIYPNYVIRILDFVILLAISISFHDSYVEINCFWYKKWPFISHRKYLHNNLEHPFFGKCLIFSLKSVHREILHLEGCPNA